MRTIWLLIPLLLGMVVFDLSRSMASAGFQDLESADSADEDKQKQEPDSPPAQEMSEMQLMERVELLQHQLQAQQISERDAAEAELKSLGPVILDFLEIPQDEVSSDTKERMLRVRQALEKLAVAGATKSTRVTLKGTMTIAEALAEIKTQTKNDVAMIDQAPPEFLNQKLVLNLRDAEFWKALNRVMDQANLAVAPYSGDRGQLRLVPKSILNPADPNAAAPVAKVNIPRDQAGIFEVQTTRIDASRNLQNPANSHTIINLLVRWEPRIQPISVVMAMKHVRIIDEFGQRISVSNEQSVVSGIVQPQIPELDFAIPIKLIDRQIEVIESLTATIDTVLPGRTETFKFKDLGKLTPGVEQSKAGVIVSYGGTRKNDDIWSVLVNIGFDETNEATESYQGWIYENEAYLVDEKGERLDFIGYESFTSEESKLGVQYLFDVDPKKCTLVYKTPAAIVKTPIVFTLKKIPLP